MYRRYTTRVKISDKKQESREKGGKLVEMGEKGAKSGKRELNDTDAQGPRPPGWYSTLIFLIFLIFAHFTQQSSDTPFSLALED